MQLSATQTVQLPYTFGQGRYRVDRDAQERGVVVEDVTTGATHTMDEQQFLEWYWSDPVLCI